MPASVNVAHVAHVAPTLHAQRTHCSVTVEVNAPFAPALADPFAAPFADALVAAFSAASTSGMNWARSLSYLKACPVSIL
jgi:hypothetical protein